MYKISTKQPLCSRILELVSFIFSSKIFFLVLDAKISLFTFKAGVDEIKGTIWDCDDSKLIDGVELLDTIEDEACIVETITEQFEIVIGAEWGMVEKVLGDGGSGKEGFLVIEEESPNQKTQLLHIYWHLFYLYLTEISQFFTNPASACWGWRAFS